MKDNRDRLPESSSAQRSSAFATCRRTVKRALPAVGLFLAAPLVAEFLLGNMSIAHLGMLAILAPLYGGGALLIRESVRRTGRSWGSIFLLALAYGVLEEAFLTESLFNPDYLGLHLDLLDRAPLPALGMGAWYTVFVLTLHGIWSIPLPIALIEALVPSRAVSPWLSKTGLGIVVGIFLAACAALANFSVRSDAAHFLASRAQFLGASACLLLLVFAAFAWRGRQTLRTSRWMAPHWVPGAVSLGLASAFLSIPGDWAWGAVLAYLLLDLVALLVLGRWSRSAAWGAIDRLSVAAGAAMAYAWHAFFAIPSLGTTGLETRMGNAVFALLALVVIAAGARRIHFGGRARAPF